MVKSICQFSIIEHIPHLCEFASLGDGCANEAARAVDHDEMLNPGVALSVEGIERMLEGRAEGKSATMRCRGAAERAHRRAARVVVRTRSAAGKHLDGL